MLLNHVPRLILIACLFTAGCDKISEVADSVQKQASDAMAEKPAAPDTPADPNTAAKPDVPATQPPASSIPVLPIPSLRDPREAIEAMLKGTAQEADILDAGRAEEVDRRRIKRLELTGASLKGVQGLVKFPELESLTILGGGLIAPEIIAPISELAALQSLNLITSGTKDATLTGLKHSTLTSLDLTNSEITNEGVSVVERLPALRSLSLNACAALDGTGFEKYPRLLELTAFSATNTSVTKHALPVILQMKELERLELQNTQLRDDSIPGRHVWPALKRLNLANNNLSDKGMLFLKNQRVLEDVDLSISQIANPTLGNLRSSGKTLNRLRIVDTKADENGINALKKLIKGLEIITD